MESRLEYRWTKIFSDLIPLLRSSSFTRFACAIYISSNVAKFFNHPSKSELWLFILRVEVLLFYFSPRNFRFFTHI